MSTTHLRIGPADQGRKMTLDEFHEAEEEPGYRYELARGVLEVTEVPSDDHGQVVDNIHHWLETYRRDHFGLIRRIAHGSDIRLLIPELESGRHPDLAVVFPDAPLNMRGRQIPALVVEIVSPGTRARRRDHEDKREEYRVLGIQEYWIVDPEQRNVTVLTCPAGSADWQEQVCENQDAVVSMLLPGLAVPVAEFWADL